MYTDVVLPNVGFGMEEGRLIAWLKAPGDPVRKGEPIAEVEGDKTTVELEALASGVLDTILVEPDTVVPIGTVLGRIRPAGTQPAAPESPSTPTTSPAASTAPAQSEADGVLASPVARKMAREHGVDLASVSGSGRGGRITREDVQAVIAGAASAGGGKVLAAPAVRKMARDAGIDLAAVPGSGKNGRVTRADVEAAIQSAEAAAAAPVETPVPAAAIATPAPATPVYGGERREIPLSNMRRTIARRLSQAMNDMPHFYVSGELDFTNAIRALPEGIGINNLLLYLTVQALQDVPELNATYEDGHLYQYPHINLAIAVALPDGLMTPVLHGADDFSLSGLANRARDLIKRTRDGRLRPEEMSGGSFTVSNLGIINQIDNFTAIINPPQVGILAVGAVKERPVVIDGGLFVRTTAHLTVSADHRIVDGLISARFIEAFDKHLQAFGGQWPSP